MLVTGGLGFLGSLVSRAMVAAEHDVVILDDASRSAPESAQEIDVPIIHGDVRSAETVERACRQVDVVVHLAAVQGTATFYREPARVLDVNVGGTLEVVRAAVRAGVRRVIFASSSEIYATPPIVPTPEQVPAVIPDVLNPRFSYSGSKIIGELLVINAMRAAGAEYTILRYHNVYGPRMGWDHVIPQFISRLERGEPFTVEGDGSQTRAFCYCSDAVDATARAAFQPTAANVVLNVGNDERECTITELISLLAEISGKSIQPIYGSAAAGGTTRRCPDIGLARTLLGYVPRVGLQEGLELTYAWYRDALANGGGRKASRLA